MEKDKTLANNPTMDDDYLFAASCQDCTGLIPGVAHDETEVENYSDLYPYLPRVPQKISDPTSPTPEVSPQTPIPEVLPSTAIPPIR